MSSGSDSIGPTAHYTGHVWARNGLSHPALDTNEGRVLYTLWQPPMLAARIIGAPTLESALLARHLAIDSILERAIAEKAVAQVVEVACGMSPRGWRFTERHPELVYVETDLPAMAARKRAALERIGRPDTHRVMELDALKPEGPQSLAAVAETLDTGAGLAIITEGLLSYLPRDAVLDLWSRFAVRWGPSPAGFTSPTCTSTPTPHGSPRAPPRHALGVRPRAGRGALQDGRRSRAGAARRGLRRGA